MTRFSAKSVPLALPLLLAVPVLLAACGSVAAPSAGPAGSGAAGTHGTTESPGPHDTFVPAGNGGTPSAARAAVCVHAASVGRVSIRAVGVTRSRGLEPRVRPRYSWLVSNPAKASALAESACALPPLPRFISCPNLTKGSYKLAFSGSGRSYPVVTVQLTGCMPATGLGLTRWATRAKAGHFWALLSGDTNSPPPGGVPPDA